MLKDQELDSKSRAKLALVMIHQFHQRRFQGGTIPAEFHFCSDVHWQRELFRTQESQRHQTYEVVDSDKRRDK